MQRQTEGDMHGQEELILVTDVDMKNHNGSRDWKHFNLFLDFWVKKRIPMVQNRLHRTYLGGNQKAVGLTAFDIT